MSDDFDFDDDGFDMPFADPAIRQGYQAAIGRFIMAHNEVDYWLSSLLHKIIKDLDPDGGLKQLALGDFAQRAANLSLIMKVHPTLPIGNVGNGRLGVLNEFRNRVAHGHFDQNDYDGSYRLVKSRRKSAVEHYDEIETTTVNEHAEELEAIALHMRAVHAFYEVPRNQFTVELAERVNAAMMAPDNQNL